MEFYINGELIDVILENEKNIGDVLKSFEITCEQNKLATIAIKIDGNIVSAQDFDITAAKPLKPETKFEMTVISENDVTVSLNSLVQPFESILEEIKEIPLHLQKGEDAQAHKTITALADIIDQFCHAATYTALFPETFQSLKVDEKTLGEFFEDFSSVLEDFKNALENKDTITIGDLAEYEICPRITGITEALKKLK